jgi:hypothetical protein
MITPFSLPSNANIQIQLREATVADAIDFADVDDGHEEELTTMFLGRMQDTGTVRDPRKWTAEDRRFALYWYWLHTTKDHDVALSYDCRHCGANHIYLQNFRDLADHYTPIDSPAEREGSWKGEKIMVRPLTGTDMEALERMRLGLNAARAGGEKSAAYKKGQAMMMFERLVLSLAFTGDKDPDKATRSEKLRKKIMGLTLDQFAEFTDLVFGKLGEMKHGLEMEYEDGRLYLIMPPHQCPERGEQTRLRYTFRNSDYIPGL